MMSAIAIILGSTGLGLIPVPTPAGAVTIMHIPAILGGIMEGPLVGLLIGLIFGIFSFMRAGSALFADPLIAILPRLFIGVLAYYTYLFLKNINKTTAYAVAGIVGTAVNTIGVLGLAMLRGYLPPAAAMSIALMHGIPEALAAAIIVTILCRILLNRQ